MRDREARMYLLIDIGQERKRKITHLSKAFVHSKHPGLIYNVWHCDRGSGRGLNYSN